MPTQPVEKTSPNAEAEVARLLSLGKCKQAVELAKDHHKRVNTVDSRKLLVRAYAARIEQFQNTGMPQEAQTLLQLVRDRFPQDRDQFTATDISSAAMAGRFADLLRPLASSEVSPEVRSRIEQAIATKVTDLPALATCDVLPAEHSLRHGAAAVWNAFQAVTAGPVTAAQIELPEISRRSPYAAWKMAIRAIALFYQSDDEGSRRALDAIPAESAVAPLVAAVRGLVDEKKPKSGIAGVIFSRVRTDDEPLRAALNRADQAFDGRYLDDLTRDIRQAVRACAASRPELIDRLRLNIATKALAYRTPIADVEMAVGPFRRDAAYWRQGALALEIVNASAQSAVSWERFVRHGVHEKLFEPNSAEEAAIWLRIAHVLSFLTLEQLEREVAFVSKHKLISVQYNGQSPDIAALKPTEDKTVAEQILLPGAAWRRAAELKGDADTFEQWWLWATKVDLPEKQKNDQAIFWNQRRPGDVHPLLYLTELAEKRNALSMAIKWLGQAEVIDPMNQQVRYARVRLTLSVAWRHFADGKAHLVEKDLTDLATLPGMQDGDRGAVLDSMRAVWHRLRKDPAGEATARQAVLDRMGPLAGGVIFHSVERAARRNVADHPDLPKELPAPLDAARAMARVIHLGQDLELKVFVPKLWRSPLLAALGERPCPLSTPELLAIADGAILIVENDVAYLATAAALSRTEPPATIARFLLLRAKSLSNFYFPDRITQCLRAALDLARQAHDENLIRVVFAAIEADRKTRWSFGGDESPEELGADLLKQVVENEREAQKMPDKNIEADPYIVNIPQKKRGFTGGPIVDDDDEDDFGLFSEDDDDDDEQGSLFSAGLPDQIPPEVLRTVTEMMLKKGLSSHEEFASDPMAMIDAMSEVMGLKFDNARKQQMADLLLKAMNEQNAGGGGKQNNKKKRKH